MLQSTDHHGQAGDEHGRGEERSRQPSFDQVLITVRPQRPAPDQRGDVEDDLHGGTKRRIEYGTSCKACLG